ncbi:MAG: hypothetical protein WC884_04150 [Candidatus Paceibacterota bacterium]
MRKNKKVSRKVLVGNWVIDGASKLENLFIDAVGKLAVIAYQKEYADLLAQGEHRKAKGLENINLKFYYDIRNNTVTTLFQIGHSTRSYGYVYNLNLISNKKILCYAKKRKN